jgi:hypothetical protein
MTATRLEARIIAQGCRHDSAKATVEQRAISASRLSLSPRLFRLFSLSPAAHRRRCIFVGVEGAQAAPAPPRQEIGWAFPFGLVVTCVPKVTVRSVSYFNAL